MKKYIPLLAFLFLFNNNNAQTIKSENGIYSLSNGELYTGIITSADENGNKKTVIEVKNGKMDGEFKQYYSDGTLMESGSYSLGLKAGLWLRFNEKGVKTAVANYQNGKKNGTWLVWDDNGNKRYEMNYQNGEKTGTWYNWDERGVLIASSMHSNGN